MRDEPADLAVIAVPPSSTARVLRDAQQRGLARVYTDVASVKAPVVSAARELGCDLSTFVPGHPLAGGHQPGPGAARADLFSNRIWALCAGEGATDEAIWMATTAVGMTGATVCLVEPALHDHAVAVSSHVPHVVSSALAALFADADSLALRLAGPGVLDATRIAAGDPALWADILRHNATAIADALSAVSDNLNTYVARLRDLAADNDQDAAALQTLLETGNLGRSQLLNR